MKTTTKLKLIAVRGTICAIPIIVSKEVYIYYLKLYNALLKAYLKNPNILRGETKI